MKQPVELYREKLLFEMRRCGIMTLQKVRLNRVAMQGTFADGLTVFNGHDYSTKANGRVEGILV